MPADAEGDVRLNVAMARIVELQRENAELRASQDLVDAEMLRQEVASLKSALAMAAVANSPAPLEAATKPGKTDTKSSGPRTATIPPKPASVAKPASPEAKRQPNRKPLTLDLR
ncbi:hypothetical protein [Sphingomonas sp. DC2100-1]|uniref:hypothetical protein n=2 Tax=unclassified Sphingomonas TaxID=196159 RepID=UPI003CED8E3F